MLINTEGSGWRRGEKRPRETGPAGVGLAAGRASGVSSTATLAVVSGQPPCAAEKVNRLGRGARGPREAAGDKLQAAGFFFFPAQN